MPNERALEQLDYVQAPNGARLQASALDGVFAAALSQFAAVLLSRLIKGDFEVISQIVVTILYYAYPLTINGQTLGKKIYGLRVLPFEGERALSFKEAFIREVVGKTISYITLLVGFFMILWRDDRRGLHDLISQTVVVQDRAVAERRKNFFGNLAKSFVISCILTISTLSYFYRSSFIADRFEAQLTSQGHKVTDVSGNLADGFRISGFEIANGNDNLKSGDIELKFTDYRKLFAERTLTFSSLTISNAELKLNSGSGETLLIGLLALPFIKNSDNANSEPEPTNAEPGKRPPFRLKKVIVNQLAIANLKIIDPAKALEFSRIEFTDLVVATKSKDVSWNSLTVQSTLLNADTKQVAFAGGSLELSAPLTATIFKVPGVKLHQPLDLIAAVKVNNGSINSLQINALKNKLTFTAQAGKDYQIWVNSLAPSDYIDGLPFDKLSFYSSKKSPFDLITASPQTASFEIGSALFVYNPQTAFASQTDSMFQALIGGERVQATHQRADGQYILRLPPGFLSTVILGAGKVELSSSTNLAPEEILYRLGAKNPLTAAKHYVSPPRMPASSR